MIEGIRCESLGKNVKIFISNEYKFSTDTVLLADFCELGKNSMVLDVGTGCGAIPLLFCRDGKGKHITAVDIQKNACELLSISIKENGLEGRIKVLNQDIRSIDVKMYGNNYDVIVCNPPYKKAQAGLESDILSRKTARNESMCCIDDIINVAAKLLKDGGELYMCSRVERMAEILLKMSNSRLEPKLLRLVQNDVYKEPKLFLVKGKKFAKSGLRCMPTLIMNINGECSKEFKSIYKSFYL